MMMVIIISLKVIICKSAYLKALKFISILCVCSLTPQPIPSINPFTSRVNDGVWSQVDHPIFVWLLLLKFEEWSFVLNRRNIDEHYGGYKLLLDTDLDIIERRKPFASSRRSNNYLGKKSFKTGLECESTCQQIIGLCLGPKLQHTMKINPYSWLRGVKKKMKFVFHLIGVYIVSIDLSCIWQVTRSQNFTIQITFICADKAAPLKRCRIKVKSYSSALTVFPFSGSKLIRFFSCSCVDILSGCEWMIKLCYSPTKSVIWAVGHGL